MKKEIGQSVGVGLWVMCKNPNGKEVRPVYVEPRIVVSPFALKTQVEAR